nr:DUF559 domain-containing protein [Roseiarcus fermentans]
MLPAEEIARNEGRRDDQRAQQQPSGPGSLRFARDDGAVRCRLGSYRQTPIGPYFVDFVCLARRVIVEADGRTHETEEARIRDAARDEWFHNAGFRVLRFPDDLVIGGLPIVVERIRAALRES